jgi:hypothetical protein
MIRANQMISSWISNHCSLGDWSRIISLTFPAASGRNLVPNVLLTGAASPINFEAGERLSTTAIQRETKFKTQLDNGKKNQKKEKLIYTWLTNVHLYEKLPKLSSGGHVCSNFGSSHSPGPKIHGAIPVAWRVHFRSSLLTKCQPIAYQSYAYAAVRNS